MLDSQVKIIVPGDGITLNLHKRGVDLLENTRDAFGVSMLDKLLCELPGVMDKCVSADWDSLAAKSEVIRNARDLYFSAYGF